MNLKARRRLSQRLLEEKIMGKKARGEFRSVSGRRHSYLIGPRTTHAAIHLLLRKPRTPSPEAHQTRPFLPDCLMGLSPNPGASLGTGNHEDHIKAGSGAQRGSERRTSTAAAEF